MLAIVLVAAAYLVLWKHNSDLADGWRIDAAIEQIDRGMMPGSSGI